MADPKSVRRGPWSTSEDNILRGLAHDPENLNWVRFSHVVGTRTPKQCRERYHQNLKPNLNHGPITPAEGIEIERLVGELGKRWAEIARRLRNRSDNAVKNWWNGNQNRLKRSQRKRQSRCQSANKNSAQARPATRPAPRTAPRPALPAQSRPIRGASYLESPRSDTTRSISSWGDLPVSSPSSSEPFEFEAGSYYTTSPPRFAHFHHPAQQGQYELPPLPNVQPLHPADTQLQTLSALSQPRQAPYYINPANRLPPLLNHQQQLPVAPSPPVQQQHGNAEGESGQRQQSRSEARDSRMDVSALVDSSNTTE